MFRNVDDEIMNDFMARTNISNEDQEKDDQLQIMQAGLGMIERHISNLRSDQLCSLAYLRLKGGEFSQLAEFFLENRHLLGSPEDLLRALENMNMMKNFKGVSGQAQPKEKQKKKGGLF